MNAHANTVDPKISENNKERSQWLKAPARLTQDSRTSQPEELKKVFVSKHKEKSLEIPIHIT